MTIDIQQILAVAKPWELTLTLDGVDHPVRRLNAAEFKRLADMSTHAESSNQQFLAGLFSGVDGQRPDVEKWDPDTASAVIGAVVAYYQEVVIRKKLRGRSAARGQAAEAVGDDWFDRFVVAAVDTTGMTMLEVFAAPFDVLIDLVAANAAMHDRTLERTEPRRAGNPNWSPGMNGMCDKLNGN